MTLPGFSFGSAAEVLDDEADEEGDSCYQIGGLRVSQPVCMMPKMRYLDPKNDLTFKKVFGQHPHLLKSFLNALLPLEPDAQIEELEYLPSELVPEVPETRNSIVDVRCVDQKKRQFIVEMQMLWTDSFMNRVLFNASKAYVKQLKTGQEYHLLQPVYSLNLVDDTFIKDSPEWYHHYRIVHALDTGRQIEGLEFVFVELPKFRPQTMPEKRLQVLWLRYLTEVGEKSAEVSTDLLAQQEVREAVEYVKESGFSEGELAAYEKYWDGVSVERTLLADAIAEGEAKGRAEGEAKGRAEGEAKGRAEGEAKGRAEGELLGKQKVALKMLRKGLGVEEISAIAEIDAEEVLRLSRLLEEFGPTAEEHCAR
jgi:predicted transposase/invertase (TIGR01784 family)